MSIVNDPQSLLNIKTEEIFHPDNADIVLFPLSISEETRNSTASYKKLPFNSYWNILFYNSASREYYYLSDQKMLITHYQYNTPIESRQTPFFFYTVYNFDYNRDRRITTYDPKYLYLSDGQGKNFKKISPDSCHVGQWTYISSTNEVLMTVTIDSDKNTIFDDNDEVTTYSFSLTTDSLPKRVFEEDFKNQLKIMYQRDWGR